MNKYWNKYETWVHEGFFAVFLFFLYIIMLPYALIGFIVSLFKRR
jgi:uncharacterized membrane protein YeiB